MTVYPWEAGTASGVTDDRERSKRVAATCLRAGGGAADKAVVTEARADLGMTTLQSSYQPTGNSWTARLGKDGRVRWRQDAGVR